jgi:hypothetical protein
MSAINIIKGWDGTQKLPTSCMMDIKKYTETERQARRRKYLLKRRKDHYEPKGSHADYWDMVECIYVDD